MSDRTTEDRAKGKSPRSAKKGGRHGGSGSSASKTSPKSGSSNWGRVLRTAYDDTLREQVPDDFLDLLGRLD